MDFLRRSGSLQDCAQLACDALVVVFLADAGQLQLDAVDPCLARVVIRAIQSRDWAFERTGAICLHGPQGLPVGRLVLCAASDESPKSFKKAFASVLASLFSTGAKDVTVGSTMRIDGAHAEALVTAAHEAGYVYTSTKPSAPAGPAWRSFSFLCTRNQASSVTAGLAAGRAIATGVRLARDYSNRPGNHLTPRIFVKEIRNQARIYGLKIEVLGKEKLQKLGMGAFLSVAQGSSETPFLVVMRYDGAGLQLSKNFEKSPTGPVVLVGKGVTFDTGGISLKAASAMDEMKHDMSGAASVVGAMAAISLLKLKLEVIAILPCCENMPGPGAVKPGDVVTTMSGQTVQVLNTDAEGRLILCDALTYAERFQPKLVIDVATLTGACAIALGHHRSGLFTAEDLVAAQLMSAGEAALDPCWRMPLDEESGESLKTHFADVANVGEKKGGAIAAALFLKRFTTKFPWAHLDVAGVARRAGPNKGATGRPVGLLTHFLMAQEREHRKPRSIV